jgi:glycosyltransferase involved in cell wall biosynthesis
MKNTLEYFSDKRYRIYPREYFTAKNIMTGVIEQTKNTYTVHHFATQYHSPEWRKQRETEQKIYRVFGERTPLAKILCKLVALGNRIKCIGLNGAVKYYHKKYIACGCEKMKTAHSWEKTIAFFEPRCTGVVHLDSAASIIDMYSKIFPEYAFLFYTEKEHGELTKQRVFAKFALFNIAIPKSPQNRMEWLKEVFWDFSMMRKIGRTKPEYIICLGNTWQIVLFAKLFQRNQKMVFFFHSIEKEIKAQIPAYRTVWWFWRSLEWNISSHVQIVFGESIRREIAKIKPKLRFKSLDLPRLPCYDDKAPMSMAVSPPVRFFVSGGGITGSISAVFLLEEKLGVMPPGFELHLKCAPDDEGRIGDVQIPDGTQVKLLTRRGSLSPEELDAYINMMDFCVFIYPSNYYLFTASGALLEALAHLKPVIALHNPYFDYVFSKMGGIGYLCDTFDEMAAVIKEIILSRDGGRYNAQRQNIMNGMRLFSTEYLADEMRAILSELELR